MLHHKPPTSRKIAGFLLYLVDSAMVEYNIDKCVTQSLFVFKDLSRFGSRKRLLVLECRRDKLSANNWNVFVAAIREQRNLCGWLAQCTAHEIFPLAKVFPKHESDRRYRPPAFSSLLPMPATCITPGPWTLLITSPSRF